MSIRYPVAPNADAALSGGLGTAARQREASTLAGEDVVFAVEPAGPAFQSREAALAAYAGRVEDDRPGGSTVSPESRFCELRELSEGRASAPLKPSLENGRRWPEPAVKPRTIWRLFVSYWRIAGPDAPPDLDQARKLRRAAQAADALDAAALRRLSSQPLKPVKPQQPLDLGLFEVRLPENPSIIVPDE